MGPSSPPGRWPALTTVVDASLVVAALVDGGPVGVWAEELLETEELTKAEASELYEEAVGLLRAVMEFKDKLAGKGGEDSGEELKRMIKAQKVADEKRWQQFIKSIK